MIPKRLAKRSARLKFTSGPNVIRAARMQPGRVRGGLAPSRRASLIAVKRLRSLLFRDTRRAN